MTTAPQLDLRRVSALPAWVAREREYSGAMLAGVLHGLAVRRRGDLLHLRAGGRWHALALVEVATGDDERGGHPRWVHFELDAHNWFALGGRGVRDVPDGSGWRAVRWLAANS